MNIAVIGGNRFTGKLLVDNLVRSHKVTLFNRSASGHVDASVIKFDRDIDDIDLNGFDCIVDMCLYTSKQFQLIKKFIPVGVRYIFISSVAVKYKDTFGTYAIEKEKIENELIDMDLNGIIVRPSYIIGYGNHIMRIQYFIDKLINNKVIKTVDCLINLVDVVDVVNCLEHIITSTDNLKGKIYEIGSDEEVTVNEIIDIIKKELNIKEYKTNKSTECIFPNQHFEVDNSNIKIDFGIEFNDINYSIKSFIERWKNES